MMSWLERAGRLDGGCSSLTNVFDRAIKRANTDKSMDVDQHCSANL
jgi:hypothetical protein